MYEKVLVALDYSPVTGHGGGGKRGQGAHRGRPDGHAASDIVEDAKLHDVGVIVMGCRGRGDLTGLVLGSTTHKVIHLTDRPVLVVR